MDRTEADAGAAAPPGCGEYAHFFTVDRYAGLECLTATFRSHLYALHAHDTYVIGGIAAGCGSLFLRGRRRYACRGDITLYNPHEVHDGTPCGGGYSYRVTYPTVALVRCIATELAGRHVAGTPSFGEPVVHDPQAVALFMHAHRLIEEHANALAADELMMRSFADCLVRHARVVPATLGREPGPVARAKAVLAQRHAEDVTLAELAAEAGLSRHHLIRAFRRETGLTPHAYLVNRRIDIAKARLRLGAPIAEVALASGFCDQAHLTRAFKARVGVTPGAFRTAVAH